MVVLGVGIIVCDEIYSFTKFESGRKQYARSYQRQVGGNAANTLVGLSRLDEETRILTRVGTDAEAEFIMESLRREGVSVDHIEKVEGASIVNHVLVDPGDRTIFKYQRFDTDKPVPVNDETFKDVSIVYLEGVCGKTDIKVCEECRTRGIPVVIGAEDNDTNIAELFPYAHAVISSREFHGQYFHNDDYKINLGKILEQGPEIAILTLGRKGAIAKTKDGLLEIDSVPTDVIDPTGAGDAFAAGFIYGLQNGCSYRKSLDFASYMGSRCCEQIGAQAGLPHKKDIEKRIAELLS